MEWFLSINPKTHGELLPTAPRTQVHPQHHDPTLMSTVTTQNLRSTTTKTQIATSISRYSKPRPKSVMLLLHKSKPKPIDWLRRRQIEDVGGGYGVGGGERREEKGENSPDWRRSVGWSCVGVWVGVEVWVDFGPSTECGVELRRSVGRRWSVG